MKHYIIQIFLLFTCWFFAIPVEAVTKAEADKAYQEKKYQQAIKDYENLVVKFNSKLTSEAEIKRFLGV